MLLYELTITEDVVDFPTKEVRHRAMLDKLRRKSSYYDGHGRPTDQHPDLKPKEPHLKAVPDMEETGGVGIITKQNTTADVKPGETGRQANKFNLDVDSKGTPKLLKP